MVFIGHTSSKDNMNVQYREHEKLNSQKVRYLAFIILFEVLVQICKCFRRHPSTEKVLQGVNT